MSLLQRVNEATKSKTNLTADQMHRIVDSMHDMIGRGAAEDEYEAAHANLENIAGFDTASEDVVEKVIGHLVTLYQTKHS